MMTLTLRAFAPYLLPLLLAGCPSAPVAPDPAEVGPVPELEVLYSANLFEAGTNFIVFSDDASTFIAGGRYDGVGLYRANDYAQLERYYESDKSQLKFKGDLGITKVYISDMGYIDANTWYFATITKGEAPPDKHPEDYTNVHIRSIQPSREIVKYSFLGRQKVAVNSRYIAFGESYRKIDTALLIDWRTGEQTLADIVSFYRGFGEHFELTRSNRLLSSAVYLPSPNTMLADPFNHKTEKLDWYVTFSPDERYAIDFSERRCKLRKFSGKDVAPIQKQEIAGYCSERLSRKADKMYKWVSFSPDGKSFVVATGRDVRVYRVEPFQLALEIRMPGQVVEAALSDDGWLAVSDKDKFLRLWDVATGSLAGQHQGTYLDLLRFQPGGNKLMAAGSDGITVFALPERTGR